MRVCIWCCEHSMLFCGNVLVFKCLYDEPVSRSHDMSGLNYKLVLSYAAIT